MEEMTWWEVIKLVLTPSALRPITKVMPIKKFTQSDNHV